MSEDEIAERAAEVARRKIAGWISVLTTALCAGLLIAIYLNRAPRPALFVETLLACAVAATIVFVARAIDGPIALRSRRRSDAASAGAAGIIMMWLGCFATLETAFISLDLIGKVGSFIEARALRTTAVSSRVDREEECRKGTLQIEVNVRLAQGVAVATAQSPKAKDGRPYLSGCTPARIDAIGNAGEGP